jgi:hypothetical protein
MILNCTWPYRAAQCPRSFNTSLRPTDEPLVAVCQACLERVYLCRTPGEAEARAARGERVAKGYDLPGEVYPETVVERRDARRGPPADGVVQ